MTDGQQLSLCPLRLTNIPGYEGRFNDVVYCYPYKQIDKSDVLVFFGGDVQDFTENMKSHRDNKNYIKWNLENTAQLLQLTFSHSHIIVVRPSSMEYKTFSCYGNFVPCNKCGVPDHVSMYNGLNHLQQLIVSISEKLKTMSDDDIKNATELSRKALIGEHTSDPPRDDSPTNLKKHNAVDKFKRRNINLENCDIKLIGFSKGCVVLNQFLYEFHHYTTVKSKDPDQHMIISKIKDMFWLDGGHSGGKNTWVTSKPLLETLSNLGIKIHVHVTPYQIEDDRRPWIKKEEKLFSETLRKLGVSIERTIHFQSIPANLSMHFDLLRVFGK